MFIDHVHLLVQAGNGGNGCESYHHRPDRKIVPNGGDGGHGGAVIFRADVNAPSLVSMRFKQHMMAPSGGHGGPTRKRGRNGENLVILVPVGTRIIDRDKNLVVRDLAKQGDEVLLLKGGEGGVGNDGNREATKGEPGQMLNLELNVLLIADVLILGLPNSGKSKLLNLLTRAKAKEENYAFTTRTPEVGVWQYSDYEQMTLCELPSVYEASLEGRGMGVDFLKHLERGKMVLLMLDPISQFCGSLKEGLGILRETIRQYREEFLERPFAVIVNKMDLEEAKEAVKAQKFKPKAPVFYISAATGEGMEKLKDFLKENVAGQVTH